MTEKTPDPRKRYRNDPDPRKRFADVFIDGEPVVTPLLLPDDHEVLDETERDRRAKRDEFLEKSDHAHPMAPEDRLGEGEIQVTFGKWIKNPNRSS